MVILLHLQAQDVKIFVIALNLLEGHPVTVRHFHRPVVRSAQRNTITLPHFFHAGLLPPFIQQWTDLPGLAKGIVYYQDVLGIVTKVRRYHVPNLEANRQGAHQHHHGHNILNHDNDLAVNRLGLEPKRSPDNLNRLRFLDEQRRDNTGKDTQHQDKSEHQQDIDWCNGLENRHLILQNSGSRRRKRFGQQDGQQHRDSADEGALGNHFEEDASFIGTNKAPGGHFLGPEARQGRGHIDIVQHGKRQEQDAHGKQQIHETAVAELDGIRAIPYPFIQEIHVPERNDPDLVVLAFIHPEILFTPVQDVAMPGLQVGTRISHHEADAAARVAHIFVV